MEIVIQPHDLDILELALRNDYIEEQEIPWGGWYQSKMRRLRNLCKEGLLRMEIPHRQQKNRYYLTEKGEKVLRWWRREPFNDKRG